MGVERCTLSLLVDFAIDGMRGGVKGAVCSLVEFSLLLFWRWGGEREETKFAWWVSCYLLLCFSWGPGGLIMTVRAKMSVGME